MQRACGPCGRMALIGGLSRVGAQRRGDLTRRRIRRFPVTRSSTFPLAERTGSVVREPPSMAIPMRRASPAVCAEGREAPCAD
jgi:hypothetical protein